MKCRKISLQQSFLFVVLLFIPVFAKANFPSGDIAPDEATLLQTGQVTGTVFDATGVPLPGVNVVVSGTTIGTVTDADGRFTLSNAPANAILVISSMGYVTQTLAATPSMSITLDEQAEAMEEVVVIGYGSVRRSDLTGSIATVTPRSFLDQPASAGLSVLSGRAPGVVVRQANGAPGEGATIRIRGINSIRGDNAPLIVVDGNYASMPNLYDIESIEILKDASATAIYGSRGANGVIIVTTRRGSAAGKNEVKVFSNVSFDHLPNNWRYDMMEAPEYAQFTNSFLVGMGQPPQFSEEQIRSMGRGTDWQSVMFKTGVSQNHKVIFTGGNEKMKYYVSPEYSRTEGIMINSWAESYGMNAKLDAELNSRISYQLEANVSQSERYNPDLGRGSGHTSMPLTAALTWSPTTSVRDEQGNFILMDAFGSRMLNPVLMTTKRDLRLSKSGGVVGNVRIKIIDGLTFDGKASMRYGVSGRREFTPAEMNAGRTDASQRNRESQTWLVNSVLTYNRTLQEKHNMSLMAGFEQTQSQWREFRADAKGIMDPDVGWDNLAMASMYEIFSEFSNDALRSFFGRVNYNYDSRYYLTGTYRVDGSSKFLGDNRFSHFPSFAVAWRISEEDFLKDLDIFQNMRIRGSWGVTGSQAIGAYATISPLGRTTYSWGTNQTHIGFHPGAPSNRNLQWEETTTYDVGFDLTALSGKLNFTFDYYYKKTDKLLSRITVPLYNGGENIDTNVGNLENKGFEVNLNYVVFENRDWTYDINMNASYNRNKVLDLGEHNRLWGGAGISGVTPNSPFAILPGHPIGTIYGYKYLGIWQQGQRTEAARYGQIPGEYRYEDLNDNGSYDAGDYQVIGSATPKFTRGFNNHLSWRNWDLNILVEGLHGRDIINLTYCTVNNIFDQASTVKGRAGKDRWSPENPNAEFSMLTTNNILMANSSHYMQDGSYIKLRNISLARRFAITDIMRVRAAVSAQNVFRYTKYKGYDPEVSSSGSDSDTGLDWFAYPNPRTYTISVSLEF